MVLSQVVDGEDLQIWRVAVNTLYKQSAVGGRQSLVVVWGLRTSHKKPECYEMLHSAVDWDGLFGTAQETENGHELGSLGCQKSL
jgi:hypothetical protein